MLAATLKFPSPHQPVPSEREIAQREGCIDDQRGSVARVSITTGFPASENIQRSGHPLRADE
jgi:hypothetical protein